MQLLCLLYFVYFLLPFQRGEPDEVKSNKALKQESSAVQEQFLAEQRERDAQVAALENFEQKKQHSTELDNAKSDLRSMQKLADPVGKTESRILYMTTTHSDTTSLSPAFRCTKPVYLLRDYHR